MPQSWMTEKVCASLLLLFAIASSRLVIAQQPLAAGFHKSGDAQKLSSDVIYDELKARGIDPLLPSAPAKLRQAFVAYASKTGSGVEFSILWPIISPICHSTRPV
jgi:hypothetical protein